MILLGKINELNVLHSLCEKVYITPTIKEEYGEEAAGVDRERA